MAWRNIFGASAQHPADTPPDGDFARYVENLVEQQSRALSGGQHMAPLAGSPRAAARASAPDALKAGTRARARDDIGNALNSENTQRPARLRIPPFFLFMSVIILLGVTAAGGRGWTWPFFILVWLYVLWRVARAVFSLLAGGKSVRRPQRK